ncbi:7084_t:CDS:1, partial [Acaulospora morrowiae]
PQRQKLAKSISARVILVRAVLICLSDIWFTIQPNSLDYPSSRVP